MPLTVASLEAVLDLNKKGFEAGLSGAKKGLSGLSSVAAPVGIAIGAIGSGLAATAVIATNTANDIDMAVDQIATGLGLSEEAASGFQDNLESIFSNNFGESFEDIADTISIVNRNLGDLSDAELNRVSETALALRDAFGLEVNETLDATRVLMEEFGVTSQEALDLVTKGIQTIPADDLIDSVREYSNQFGDAGFKADQFFSLLESGTAGGVLGTDKVGDAIKEFSIRALEGGKEVEAAFGTLSSASENLFGQYQDGSIDTAEALDLIIARLREQDDLVEQNRLGVAFFGTQWEDLGAEAVLALDSQVVKMEDVAGATDTLNQQYDNMGAALEGLKRRALVAVAPIGEIFLELFNKAEPFLSSFLEQAQPVLDKFAETLGDKLPDVMGRVGDALAKITGDSDGMAASITILESVLDGIINTLEFVAQGFERVSAAVEIGRGLIDQVGQITELSQGQGFEQTSQRVGEGILAGLGFGDFSVASPSSATNQSNININVSGNINGDQHLQEVVGRSFGQLRNALH